MGREPKRNQRETKWGTHREGGHGETTGSLEGTNNPNTHAASVWRTRLPAAPKPEPELDLITNKTRSTTQKHQHSGTQQKTKPYAPTCQNQEPGPDQNQTRSQNQTQRDTNVTRGHEEGNLRLVTQHPSKQHSKNRTRPPTEPNNARSKTTQLKHQNQNQNQNQTQRKRNTGDPTEETNLELRLLRRPRALERWHRRQTDHKEPKEGPSGVPV